MMSSKASTEKNDLPFPAKLLPSLHEIKFVCPLCRGALIVSAEAFACKTCDKTYTLHDGIPDFRVFPDPFLNYAEDHKRTEIILANLEKLSLEKLLEHYWSFSDITPPALRQKFIRSARLGEDRARRTLEIIREHDVKSSANVLEIGSGTGNFLVVAAGKFKNIVGIDIAMRWLHVSRRRFMDYNLPVPALVCCCAEFLPFEDAAFDLIVASSTLEFVRDKEKVLTESERILAENGALYVNTVNRFSIGRDPYSYLRGVGFLPRKWQPHYVNRRLGASYENIKTLSYRELKRLASSKFLVGDFILPDVAPEVLKHFSPGTRRQIGVFRFLKKRRVLKPLLNRIGPGWEIVWRKKSSRK